MVFRHEGTLDKFIGDCLMAVFGAPFETGAHAIQAVEAALDVKETLRELNAEVAEEDRVAFRIGLPCKSGVGGGIVAVVPDRLTVCVWSPAVDESGNSVLGTRALELFASRSGLSIF